MISKLSALVVVRVSDLSKPLLGNTSDKIESVSFRMVPRKSKAWLDCHAFFISPMFSTINIPIKYSAIHWLQVIAFEMFYCKRF